MSTLVGISALKWPLELLPRHIAQFCLHMLHICLHILRMPSIASARRSCPGTEVSRSRTVTKAIVASGYGDGTAHLEGTKAPPPTAAQPPRYSHIINPFYTYFCTGTRVPIEDPSFYGRFPYKY